MPKNRLDNAIRFKNGNIHIKFDKDTLERISDNKHYPYNDGMFELSESLFDVDSYLLGNQDFIGYKCFTTVYNCHDDKYYTLDLDDVENVLLKGKTLILYARKGDEFDKAYAATKGF